MVKQRVVVAVSGGKDSTAAVILLQRQGFDVHSITMRLGLPGEAERIQKIAQLTKIFDVPFKTVDLGEVFREKVIEYFIGAYAGGLTPNPCVVCNKEIKFNLLMNHALEEEGVDFYATGHYAAKTQVKGDFLLKEPLDKEKSQIYFLSMIGKEKLKRVIFPLANVKVDEIRKIVKRLPLANRHESQDACFLEGESIMDYLRRYVPEKFQEGDILDMNGRKIGTHEGSIYFTIGQRRGLHFASQHKLYVVKKDVENNTITLGEDRYLYSDSIRVMSPVFWQEIYPGEVYKVKIRYFGPFEEAEIVEASTHHIQARFKQPVRAVTPGQVGAFYRDDVIAAAGCIT